MIVLHVEKFVELDLLVPKFVYSSFPCFFRQLIFLLGNELRCTSVPVSTA
jgi:hypothetical protein